jgi:hypothetical protein
LFAKKATASKGFGTKKFKNLVRRFSSSSPVKSVVETDFDRVDLLVDMETPLEVGVKGGSVSSPLRGPTQRNIVGTEIHVVVLDLGRPILPQAPFNASTHKPAPARMVATGRPGRVGSVTINRPTENQYKAL